MVFHITSRFPTVYPPDGKFCVTCAHKTNDMIMSDNWECRRPSAPINPVTGLPRYTTCTFERSMAGACGNHGKYYEKNPEYFPEQTP